MSNPAVITLAKLNSRNKTFKRFEIEDNIGESIHLHVDNIRLDLSVDEFLGLSEMVRKSLVDIDLFHGYDMNIFDSHFLYECADLLCGLSRISIEDVALSDLKFIVKENVHNDLIQYRTVPVDQTPAYRYLNGDTQRFTAYRQFNYFGHTNQERLLELLSSIKANGYPYQEKYIILFNGQNLVRDGQHRAAVLAHLSGINVSIKVMMFHFDGSRHYFRQHTNNFEFIVKWILKKVRSFLTGFYIN